MIKRDLREEIAEKLERISDNSHVYDGRMRLVRDTLRSMGDVYSFWVENPELRRSLYMENKQPDTVMKIARKGTRAIKDAWYFLMDHGRGRDFSEVLNEDILIGANAIVNGGSASDGRFRRKDVTLNIPGYTPPSFGKVPQKVREVISRINETFNEDPVENAIYVHLALSLIQPFNHANKRTARLVQDRLLLDAGLPPVMIPAGEGKFYMGLLSKAAPGFRDGETESQEPFYNYIASKVNNGLDYVLNDLGEDVGRIAS